MPQYISTTKKYMRDPALRCRPAMPGDNKEIAAKRRAYEKEYCRVTLYLVLENTSWNDVFLYCKNWNV